MRSRYTLWEILSLVLLVAIVLGLPAAIFGYHIRYIDEHTGRAVGVVARNDEISGKPGLWMVQRGPIWNYGDKSVPNEIEVHQDEKITLLITAVDSVHEFSLADYGVKEKIHPGEVSEITLVADKAGQFKFECTSYCGVGHDQMVGRLIVKPKGEQSAMLK